jgi:hypothetical protein
MYEKYRPNTSLDTRARFKSREDKRSLQTTESPDIKRYIRQANSRRYKDFRFV